MPPLGWRKADAATPADRLAKKRLAARERYRNLSPEERERLAAQKRAAYKKWSSSNKDHLRERARKRNYGLEPGEYDARLAAQEGRCAVCEESFRETPHVDHCHTTGKVRDILCQRCNHAAGNVRDDPAIADRLAAYLRRHQEA